MRPRENANAEFGSTVKHLELSLPIGMGKIWKQKQSIDSIKERWEMVGKLLEPSVRVGEHVPLVEEWVLRTGNVGLALKTQKHQSILLLLQSTVLE